MLRRKMPPQPRRQVQRLLRRLDDQRARTAEGVLHQAVPAYPAQIRDGRRQRFLDGGQRSVAAVPTLVQAVAGSVQIDLHLILAQGEADLVRLPRFRQRAGLVACQHPFDDGLLENALAGGHAGKLARQAGAFDRERGVGGEQFLPGDAVAAVEQFVKGRGFVGSQQQQDTFGGTQVDVSRSDQGSVPFKLHPAVGDLDVLRAQALDFKMQRGFRAEKAGCDQGILCGHRIPFF